MPLLKADSVLILEQPLLGGDELDLSIRMLGDFGADVSRCQDQRVAVPGRQRLQSRYYRVESSYGLAAYFLTAGALGQAVEVKGLLARSLQTARRILDLLETQGCRLIQGENGGIRFMPPTDFGSFPFIDCSQAPELLPLLALSAAAAPGERMISGRSIPLLPRAGCWKAVPRLCSPWEQRLPGRVRAFWCGEARD